MRSRFGFTLTAFVAAALLVAVALASGATVSDQMPRPIGLTVLGTTDSTAEFRACADKNPAADGIAWTVVPNRFSLTGWTGLPANVHVLGTRPCIVVIAKKTAAWDSVEFRVAAFSVRSGSAQSQSRTAETPIFRRPLLGPPGPITIDTTTLSLLGPMPGTLLVGCRWCGNQPRVRLTALGIFRPAGGTTASPGSVSYDANGCAQWTLNAALTFESWPHSLGFVAGYPRDEAVVAPNFHEVACRVEALDAGGTVIAAATAPTRALHLHGDASWYVHGLTQGTVAVAP